MSVASIYDTQPTTVISIVPLDVRIHAPGWPHGDVVQMLRQQLSHLGITIEPIAPQAPEPARDPQPASDPHDGYVLLSKRFKAGGSQYHRARRLLVQERIDGYQDEGGRWWVGQNWDHLTIYTDVKRKKRSST